jgi:hypothetical protein
VDYGVFAHGDRRKRPLALAPAAEVQALFSDGLIERAPNKPDAFVLPGNGGGAPTKAEGADHALAARDDGVQPLGLRRGCSGPAAALARIQDGAGKCWFQAYEVEAARRLWRDWEAGELSRRAECALPQVLGACAQAGAAPAITDARQRFAAALTALPPGQQRLVHAACLQGEGLDLLERRLGWPSRSARVALKLALEGLAVHYAAV